jgi:hypothetical protein
MREEYSSSREPVKMKVCGGWANASGVFVRCDRVRAALDNSCPAEVFRMMKRALSLVFMLALLPLGLYAQQPQPPKQQQQPQPAPPKTNLKEGQAAPDFTLTDTEGKPVRLSDFKGKKNVVLAFYVLAFTGG